MIGLYVLTLFVLPLLFALDEDLGMYSLLFLVAMFAITEAVKSVQ